MVFRFLVVVFSLSFWVASHSTSTAGTLDDVKKRGYLKCGVGTGLAGFSSPDDKGNWVGLDVDYCRALAAATLGDATKVKYTPLSAKDRFTALQSGDVDVLARNTTWTMDRDANFGLVFTAVNFFDGQGFMVRKASKITSAKQLSSATICVYSGTSTEVNLADYFRSNGMKYETKSYDNLDAVKTAYEQGACDAYTTDKSGLTSIRLSMSKPDDHEVLPETISKEPFAPMVRKGDEQWFTISKWVVYATLNAEELGLTSANVDDMKAQSQSPDVRRLLGVDGKFAERLGVSNDWAYNIIKQVGNYAQAFERNVGPNTPLKIDRGINGLWNHGGLHYGMPVR